MTPQFKTAKVYLVGGAVRDKLLGKEAIDQDFVVVGSSHEEMLELGFTQVGLSFPVYLDAQGREHALARIEKKAGLGHTAFDVETADVSLEADLGRRDFTINAMALDASGTIIDPFGGAQDLKDGIIRHLGDAFSDDPLRAIRAARFAVRYGFAIAPETILAISRVDWGDLQALSVERLHAELLKTFKDSKPNEFLALLRKLELRSLYNSVIGYVDDYVDLCFPSELLTDPNAAITAALVYSNKPKANAALTSHIKLANALEEFFSLEPDRILNSLKSVNREAKPIIDALAAPCLAKSKLLERLISAVESVKSCDFSSTGVELGREMRAAKLDKIKQVLLS